MPWLCVSFGSTSRNGCVCVVPKEHDEQFCTVAYVEVNSDRADRAESVFCVRVARYFVACMLYSASMLHVVLACCMLAVAYNLVACMLHVAWHVLYGVRAPSFLLADVATLGPASARWY